MRSQNTLVWVGAVAVAIVIAAASGLYWTHPDFLWWNPTAARVVANAPAEPKPPSVLPTPQPAQTPPPTPQARRSQTTPPRPRLRRQNPRSMW